MARIFHSASLLVLFHWIFLAPWKLPPCPFDTTMINCRSTQVRMDHCTIVQFPKGFRFNMLVRWFHHCLFTGRIPNPPRAVAAATAEHYISFFFLFSFISAWSEWFLSASIVCTYWTVKYLGIYNRGVIDNHFIPVTVSTPKTLRNPFYMRKLHFPTSISWLID